MTIGNAFSNALSGLSAASRGAAVIADNIANAGTEGFRRRELALTTSAHSGGVRVEGAQRVPDAATLADRRLTDAGLARAEGRSAFFARLEALLGVPGTPGALTDRIARLEQTLTEAAARPEETARLAAVADAAAHFAQGIRDASGALSDLRAEADASLAGQLRSLNEGLARVDALNNAIARQEALRGDANALRDEREQVIDSVAALVPLRIVPRADGRVALFSEGGAVLLDARPVTVSLATPAATLPAPVLALDGRPAATDGPGAALAGGVLQTQIEVRDRLVPEAQAALDALARDLVERLADPALDPTLAAGDPGLFTDAGTAFDPANEAGLAVRLVVNPAVDPAAGGALHRLRDGLNAAAPGPAGDGSLLAELAGRLAVPRLPASPALTGPAGGVAALTAGLVSAAGTARQAAEAEQSFLAAQRGSLSAAEAGTQVNTDTELQNLLRVEQSFAANARVIEAIGQMLDELQRI